MIDKDITEHYLKNVLNREEDEANRLFGLEIELTLASLSDYRIVKDPSITEKLLLRIASEKNWEIIYDKVSNKPIRIETLNGSSEHKLSISPDFSVSTLEISTIPETSLQTLLENTQDIGTKVNLIAKRNGLCLIAGGVHPFASPDQSDIYSFNSRYVKTLLSEEMPQLICQSLQFTFSLNADELVPMYSTLQKLIPLFSRLFSASPVYNGKITDKFSFREWFYLQRSLLDRRYGFGPQIKSINDYYNLVIDYPLSRIIRNGKTVFLDKMVPFREFAKYRTHFSAGIDDGRSIIDDFEVFESTIWHNIRIKSRIGAIEIRSTDSLPMPYIAPFASFIRGIIANINEVKSFIDVIEFKHLPHLYKKSIIEGLGNDIFTQKMLPHIISLAQKGLYVIGEANCICHLDKLKKFIYDKKNIASEIQEQFRGSNNSEERMFKVMSILSWP